MTLREFEKWLVQQKANACCDGGEVSVTDGLASDDLNVRMAAEEAANVSWGRQLAYTDVIQMFRDEILSGKLSNFSPVGENANSGCALKA